MIFHISTLGCKVNQHESDILAAALRTRGWQVVEDGQVADVCIVNTCTVTNQADADARFELWWRIRTITENANNQIIAAMKLAEASGKDSELAQRAAEFSGKLVPMGATLSAIANEPCVFLPRVSEEGENVRRCPSGYALRGLRCSGKFCDDKDLLCCPYLDGAPDPTAKEMNSRWVSEEVPNVLTSKKFFNGLTCRGPYCDDSFMHQFKSSRLTNTRECGWTPWYTEQTAPWLDCGLGSFMAGIRCQYDYCGDVAIYCCKARVE